MMNVLSYITCWPTLTDLNMYVSTYLNISDSNFCLVIRQSGLHLFSLWLSEWVLTIYYEQLVIPFTIFGLWSPRLSGFSLIK